MGALLQKLLGERIFLLIKPYLKRQLLVLLLSIIGSILSLQFPMLFKSIVDDIIPSKNYSRLVSILILYSGLFLLGNFFSFFTQYTLTVTIELFSYNLKKKLYTHLHSLPMTFFNKTPIGEIISSFNADISTISQFLTKNFLVIINDVFGIVVISTMLLLLNWKLALVCFLFIPLFFVITFFSKRIMKKRFNIIRDLITDENKLFQNVFTNMKLIKLLTMQKKSLKLFLTLQGKLFHEKVKTAVTGSLLGQSLSVVTLFAPVTIILIGAGMIYHSELTLGGLMAFLTYIGKLFSPFNDLVGINVQLQNFNVSFERVIRYTDIAPEEHANSTYKIGEGNISYVGVNFSYENSPVLTDINIHINSGEKVLLLGKNGSGKTTLVNLLLKLYNIDSGSILIDGTDIREYSTRYLRKNIGIVTQEMSFFNMSIEDNLKMSCFSCTVDEMIIACKITGVYEFISTLNDGFKTIVGERGVNLSGGQMQKLAITRLILKKPKIIIFDEASSALDYGSSNLLYSLLDTAFKHTTVICITHDIDNLINADKVIVLGEKRVLKQYSKEEVLNSSDLLCFLKENIS
jgi:ATP-binding cassette subfamily B protein